MAVESKLRPHDILRLLQQGRRGELLSSQSIWLCLTCETCTARCPNECDPARIIDALREIAWNEGLADPPRKIEAFHRSFLNQIRRSGRIFEFGLVAGYKMRSGALFSDVLSVPGMLSRGKLALAPVRITRIKEIRRIFDTCLESAPHDSSSPEDSGADTHETDGKGTVHPASATIEEESSGNGRQGSPPLDGASNNGERRNS